MLVWIYVAFALGTLMERLSGAENATEKLSRRLLDKTLLNPEAERMYVFGDKDAMVLAEDVLRNARLAKEQGWKVRMERYVGGGHCTHAAADPTRYWDAVIKLWQFEDGEGYEALEPAHKAST